MPSEAQSANAQRAPESTIIVLDKGVSVSSTNVTELERTLLRSGDDIYRLALLLCADESSAAQVLIKAISRLATSGSAPNQQALLAALLAVLPPERWRW